MLLIFYLFFPNKLISFLIGSGWSIFMGLGKIGNNKENLSDYLETNKDKFVNDKI
jgi:hypothetical protein